jgi:hypothetical protein
MTEQYISGYLEAISRVKDILTPNVGGLNQFFSIDKNPKIELIDNIKKFIELNKEWYLAYNHSFAEILNKITLVEITDWKVNLESKISEWTCDKKLSDVNGKNGFYLSEYLVQFLLKDFFKEKELKVYKMLPDWGDWHWGDQMSEEFIFDTNDKIYIMHFGESS